MVQALQAGATYPDGRYPNMFLFYLVPTQAHTTDEAVRALEAALNRVKTQRVGPDALNQAKSQVRALSFDRLQSNTTMAEMLALYAASYGDWRKLFTLTDDVRSVTEEDLIRVAQRYFQPTTRTIVFTGSAAQAVPVSPGGAQ